MVPTDWLAKERLVRERPAAGTVPVPERLTVWLPLAVSVMLSVAMRAPVVEGVNSTAIEKLAPVATELPQLLV